MQKITVYAGPSTTDKREVGVSDWSEYGPEEALRRIGLEYKTADYFPQREVVITIQPDSDLMLDPVTAEIHRLRRALIASGVKEGLVDAIQKGSA
jgi:hypothetical protein